MPTNLAIDDELLERAQDRGRANRKATVTQALLEYIQRREQAAVVELFGKVDFDPTYDYKEHRRRR
ncbi:MAG: type II toxin-antitoxin system VapB family antitoxin [Polyangiaceae bacterium]